MPRQSPTGLGRGNAPRPRPLRPLAAVALVALGATLIVVAAVVGAQNPGQPEYPSAGLVAELRGLKMANGLFGRPGLSGQGAPSWYASAYGLPVLKAAGLQPSTSWDPPATGELARAAMADDPLWSRWYMLQVERATGLSLPGEWAFGIGGLLSNMQLDVSGTGSSERLAAETTMVSVAVQIAEAKAVLLTPAVQSLAAGKLEVALRESTSAYLQCQAVRGLRALGHAEVQLGNEPAALPTSITSVEDLLDLHGMACLEGLGEVVITPRQRESALGTLRPLLDIDAPAADFGAYHAAISWSLLGGGTAELQPMAHRLQQRIDPQTGLLREDVVVLGTVETTYQVSRLTNEHFAAMAGQETISAVHSSLPAARQATDVNGLLAGAVVLDRAGAPDPRLRAEALTAFNDSVSGPVERERLPVVLQGISLIAELGLEPRQVDVVPFEVAGAEDRFLAWRLLSQIDHVSNRNELLDTYRAVVDSLPGVLSSPDGLQAREVHAAVLALMAVGGGERIPWDQLDAWALTLRGCSGLRELYRPAVDADDCSVESTAQILLVDLGPSSAVRLKPRD